MKKAQFVEALERQMQGYGFTMWTVSFNGDRWLSFTIRDVTTGALIDVVMMSETKNPWSIKNLLKAMDKLNMALE